MEPLHVAIADEWVLVQVHFGLTCKIKPLENKSTCALPDSKRYKLGIVVQLRHVQRCYGVLEVLFLYDKEFSSGIRIFFNVIVRNVRIRET